MAYKQNPLKYSRTSNMPGVEFADEDISMKERLATNALGVTPPEDLFDGEFFLKDNDPQDFYRTLYIKRGESLDKILTVTDTGKVLFDGINIVNLDDDEEVKGVLPKRKIITASATVPMDNIQNIVAYDGSKFQEVAKSDLTNKIVEQVNAGIDLTNYFNKDTDKINLTSQVEDVLPVANGGTGKDNLKNIENFLHWNDFVTKYNMKSTYNTTQEFIEDLVLNKISSVKTHPTRLTILDLPFSSGIMSISIYDNSALSLQVVRARNYEEYLGVVNENNFLGWVKTRNSNGTIPASCGGVLTKYENSDGIWTETLLETGEIMLEGNGSNSMIMTSKSQKNIPIPKYTKYILDLRVQEVSSSDSIIGNRLNIIININDIVITNTSNESVVGYWSFKGILEQ